jgi:alginate O-acetyltransferase complex protein AlgI
MDYTTLVFLLFLLVVAIGAWTLPRTLKSPWLLVCSYAFYAAWNARYLPVLVAVSLVVYGAARGIDRLKAEEPRKWATIAAVSSVLAVLVFFKYPEALLAAVRAGGGPGFAIAAAPLGISYYVFKALSYLLDVYWETSVAERDPLKVALYIAFFPQIVSGPIQRAPSFLEQARGADFCRASAQGFERALGLMLLGFFEKLVIADRIGPLVGALDAYPAPSQALLADYGYALQLFADFSGLTHVALGLGLLFGIEGPPNFNRPFAAPTIQEYWRRWHMSLTGWLTDYLFMPLRMALRKWGGLGLCASLMVNMVLIGIWHGSRLTYLAFGAIHGAFLVVSSLTLPPRNRFFKVHSELARIRALLAPLITFHLVVFGLVFFRFPSIGASLVNLRAILGPSMGEVANRTVIDRDVWVSGSVASAVAFELATGYLGLYRLGNWVATTSTPLARWWMFSGGALLVVLLAKVGGGQFMYARF